MTPIAINTDYQAFIRKICEEPDELTHRLVFADWLDENGDEEWATLIRLQIEQGDTMYVCSNMISSITNYRTLQAFRPLFNRWFSLGLLNYTVSLGFINSVSVSYGYVTFYYQSLLEWPITKLNIPDAATRCYDYHNDDEYYYCPFSLPDGKSVDRSSGPGPICQEVGQRLLDYYRKELKLPPLKRN